MITYPCWDIIYPHPPPHPTLNGGLVIPALQSVKTWFSNYIPFKTMDAITDRCPTLNLTILVVADVRHVWCVNVGALYTPQQISTRFALLCFVVGTVQFYPRLSLLFYWNEGSLLICGYNCMNQLRADDITTNKTKHNKNIVETLWAWYHNMRVSIYVCISRCVSRRLCA